MKQKGETMENKNRLIDADELLSNGFITENVRFKRGRFCIPWGDIKRSVKNAPTIDAVEVVHGRWDEFNSFMTCSECDTDWDYTDNDTDRFNYCPNCGAKMDGDEDA